MAEYVEAIKKPFGDIKTLVIGTVIGIIPIVNFLLFGYGLMTMKKVLSGKKELVEWRFGSLVEMIVLLVKGFVVSIVYGIPSAIVLVLGLGSIFSSFVSAAQQGGDLNLVIMQALFSGAIYLILWFILLLLAAFLLPMALANWLKEDSLMAAFSFGTVFKKAFRLNYIIAFIVVILYSIVWCAIMFLTAVIPFLIFIVLGLVSYLLTVTTNTVYAEVFKEK